MQKDKSGSNIVILFFGLIFLNLVLVVVLGLILGNNSLSATLPSNDDNLPESLSLLLVPNSLPVSFPESLAK